MTSAERNIKVYCPTHKTDFDVQTVGRIVCASDPHLLADDFPNESFWEYCCDCKRFWPSDLKHGGQGAAACAVCQRAAARRYLCDQCKVVSVESDDAGFRKKDYSIAAGGGVGPACPGCGVSTEGAAPRLHDCRAVLTVFRTARASCPFCEEPLDGASRQKDSESAGISFPASAEDCLKDAAGREAKVVKYDPLRDIFVKDRDGTGRLILVHDWAVPGGVLYLLPRTIYFETPEDFYNLHELLYDCARPTGGVVWVSKPAVVKKVTGGWSLLEKGELEIRKSTPRPERSKGRPQADVRRAPEAKADPPPSQPVKPAPQNQQTQTQSRQKQTTQTQTRTQTRTQPPKAGPSPKSAERQSRPTTETNVSTAAKAYVAAARESRPDANGRRRVLSAVIGAFIAVAGIGLLVAAIASRGSSTSGTSNASNAARNSNAAEAGSANNFSPSNLPPGMVYVPGGKFVMGSGNDAYERPAHEVSVGAFFIDTYEVTCGDYAKFVAAEGHAAPPSWSGKTCPAGSERLPVTGVTWYDAQAYAKWAGKRLPTEAEWEFAARGTDGRKYPWGDEWEGGAANVSGDGGQLADVGTYRSPSPFGAYDMSGNVWEWTASDFAVYPGGDASLAKKQRQGKVIRGGCYTSKTGQATTTYRGVWPPQGENYDRTGFRCVMGMP